MSKWDGQVEQSKSEVEKELELSDDAIDTEVEIRRNILNNAQGPIDTPDKLNAQKHNLGPKDTPIENEELDIPPPSPRP